MYLNENKDYAWLKDARCRNIFLLTDAECDACSSPEEMSNANIRKIHELFFPEKGDIDGAVKAIAICEKCPVRADCLKESLENNERIGIWGGTSGRTRRRITRMKNIVSLTQTIVPDDEDYEEE